MAGFQKEVLNDFFQLSEEDKNGYKYYIIPEGTRLYRGDTQLYLDHKYNTNIVLEKKPIFFAKDYEVASKYGVVFEFIVNKEYKLLAIDNRETIEKLYNDLKDNKRIRNILENNYGAITGLRLTEMDDDLKFSNYLCHNNYSGYAANLMPTNTLYSNGDKVYIHRELMICNTDNLSFIKMYTDRIDLDKLIEEHKSRITANKLRTKRKKSKYCEDVNSNYQLYTEDVNSFHQLKQSVFDFTNSLSSPQKYNNFNTPTNTPPNNFNTPTNTPPNNFTPQGLFTGKKTKKSNKTKKRKTIKKNNKTKKH